MKDRDHLLQALKGELAFLEAGGYQRGPRYPWRPNFVFEDSPTCLNFRADSDARRPCSECSLIEFVPQDKREARIPCRHIRLNDTGETVLSFYEYGTEEELQNALARWLKKVIQSLEEADKPQAKHAGESK